jgi:hypothetical protein
LSETVHVLILFLQSQWAVRRLVATAPTIFPNLLRLRH